MISGPILRYSLSLYLCGGLSKAGHGEAQLHSWLVLVIGEDEPRRGTSPAAAAWQHRRLAPAMRPSVLELPRENGAKEHHCSFRVINANPEF
jgi:hypothetical protein